MVDDHTPIQVQCTCTCADQPPTFSPGKQSWQDALLMHERGIVQLVSKRPAYLTWFHRIFRDYPSPKECGYRVSLAEMHRMYMRALQIELVKIGVSLRFDGPHGYRTNEKRTSAALKDLEPALVKYMNIAQAVRDYEYMTTTSRAYDYFVASYERYEDKNVIRMEMNKHLNDENAFYRDHRKKARATGPWEKTSEGELPNPIGGTRNENVKSLIRKAFWWKVGAAVVGGGFLVGPMWLLALKQRLYLQLEVTTGFVFGFGLVLSYFVDKIDQVFAGTLAYAAVLMVFVGLSIQAAA